jgi:hypothetical protein
LVTTVKHFLTVGQSRFIDARATAAITPQNAPQIIMQMAIEKASLRSEMRHSCFLRIVVAKVNPITGPIIGLISIEAIVVVAESVARPMVATHAAQEVSKT